MSESTRSEHLQWCKERALSEYRFYVDRGDGEEVARRNAIASMLSDLTKHPETAGSAKSCVMLAFMVRDHASLMRFINGFN